MINLPVFEIITILFFYFLFLWTFRIVIGILILKVAGKIKEGIEKNVKEKMDSLKGGIKENEGL